MTEEEIIEPIIGQMIGGIGARIREGLSEVGIQVRFKEDILYREGFREFAFLN